jgi:hypothetical protein
MSEHELRTPDLREATVGRLHAMGFRVALGLPISRGELDRLRPPVEIASRLMALNALFSWVALGEKQAGAEQIKGQVERERLDAWLLGEERAMLSLPRREAREQHAGDIGWRLENMWPLAWVLGFEKVPLLDGDMIEPPTIEALVLGFMPGFDAGPQQLVDRATLRPELQVIALEDLFYCAHNAVRSAQLGEPTVPEDFNPTVNGGVIHERRHALTWCVSPGVGWAEVNLST